MIICTSVAILALLLPIFLLMIGSRFWSVSYPMLLRSFCMATFAVVPEPRNGSSTDVTFDAEHFDKAVGNFVWVGSGSSFHFACRLPRSFKSPDLAKPFVTLRFCEGAVIARLVVRLEFAEAAFSKKENEFASRVSHRRLYGQGRALLMRFSLVFCMLFMHFLVYLAKAHIVIHNL